ncbi:MAG: hypothetical protein ABIB43_05850 [archaeon]
MSENKCPVHGLFVETTCSWCGDPICKNCIESSNLRKYCTKCYGKLTKGSVANFLDKKPWGEKPEGKIRNVTPGLSEEEIKKKRQMLEIKEKARKIMGENNPKTKRY